MTICYKMGNVQDTQNNSPPEVPPRPNSISSPSSNSQFYPNISGDGSDHDYEMLLPNYTPSRPAPKPPAPLPPMNIPTQTACNTNTLSAHYGLEGVPFVLNSRLTGAGTGNVFPQVQLPTIRARTMQQLNKDYHYDFRAERQN